MVKTAHTGAELVQYMAEAATSPISLIKMDTESGIFDLPAPAIYPKALRAMGKQLEVDLQGHHGIAKPANPAIPWEFMIGRPQPVNADEANNVMQSQGFSLIKGSLDGKGVAVNAVLHRCGFHDLIQKVTTKNTTNGIIMEFCMNSLMKLCETRATPGIGFGIHRGTYVGAGDNSAGSNGTKAELCRSFPLHGQFACFSTNDTGMGIFDLCKVDAATNNTPQRGFLVDHRDCTTAKNNPITNSWVESPCSVAAFDLILNGGVVWISGTYPQKAGTLIRATGKNYTELYLDMTGTVHGQAKLDCAGTPGAVVWSFMNNPTTFDFLNPVNWINGQMPNKYHMEYFGKTKGREIRTQGSLMLNGSKVVTELMMKTELANYQKIS